jgi:hypothetical protein
MKMAVRQPTIQEWRDLYDAAIAFKRVACWEWMWDTDLFGVQDPKTGETGYCCVMGRLGEHRALAVYPGSKGLTTYCLFRDEDDSMEMAELMNSQICLMASFEDKSFLQPPDKESIKACGLSFRGVAACPCFRSYRPGYFPWYINKEEALVLTHALRQAVEVGLRVKDNPKLLEHPREGQYLVRIPSMRDGKMEWIDAWLAPKPYTEKPVFGEPLDEKQVARVLKTASRGKAVWEIEVTYSPARIHEKNTRPYFPRLLFCRDQTSGHILIAHAASHESYAKKFPKKLLDCMEKTGVIPAAICTRKEETLDLLAEVAERLKIEAEITPFLPGMEEALRDMEEYFARSPGEESR